MAEIDTISKYLIQHYPDHFARFALARDDIEVIEIIETEQTMKPAEQIALSACVSMVRRH